LQPTAVTPEMPLMKRWTMSLIVLAGLVGSESVSLAGPLADLLRTPSSGGAVVVTSRYKTGQTKYRVTYPGYVNGVDAFEPPGWMMFGYPGTQYPTNRASNSFGFNGP
jgi:hypothetical protein